ncbi:MAG: hypothetical protein ACI9BD_001605 [Candidatus Marinamargulisbacteria bacterium]|jgi:hypothetical protein
MGAEVVEVVMDLETGENMKPSEYFIKSSEKLVDEMNISPEVKEDLKKILNGQKRAGSETFGNDEKGTVI